MSKELDELINSKELEKLDIDVIYNNGKKDNLIKSFSTRDRDIDGHRNKDKDTDTDSVFVDIKKTVEKDRLDTNVGKWNYKIQLLLKQIGERCQGLRYMHCKEQEFFEHQEESYNTYETWILAFLGIITGGELGALMTKSGLEDNLVLITALTSIQLLLVCIHYIVKNIKFNREFIRHEIAHERLSNKFHMVELDIRMQMALNLKNRVNDKEFLRGTIKSFNNILDHREIIRQETKEKYLTASKDYSIYKPMIIGGFEQIIISNNGHITESDNISSEIEDDDHKYKYEINRWLKNF